MSIDQKDEKGVNSFGLETCSPKRRE